VIRGHMGNWIKIAANYGIYSLVKTELLALFQGLRLAWSLGIKHLPVHMDLEMDVLQNEGLYCEKSTILLYC